MAGDSSGLRAETVAQIQARIAATNAERDHSREKIASGDWRGAEPDNTRIVAYSARVDRKAGNAEAKRGTNDFQPASFLSEGAKARRAVALTVLDTPLETRTGTGFLISDSLLLTNQHVVKDANEAALTRIEFDYELDERGEIRPSTVFELDPEKLFLSSDETDLDYALIAVGRRSRGSGALADFGFCALSRTPDRHQLGINANIVQHPDGQRKLIVIRNNLILARGEENGRLYYETDTLEGSSGSPVFNDLWDVVALHHYGESAQDVVLVDGTKTRSVNEGIRISSIYDDLSAKVGSLVGPAREMLEQALVLWKSEAPPERRLTPVPRPPAAVVATGPSVSEAAKVIHPAPKEISTMTDAEPEATIVVPLEISLRVGRPSKASTAPAQPNGRSLTTAPRSLAEAKRIDRDYANRNGFDEKFVPGVQIDLAKIVEPAKTLVAPLLEPQRGRTPGELFYQNFSVLLHKLHRVAMLTATNIDGDTYIAIDRKTGEPAEDQPVREGDTWYKDPRINEIYTLTNDFYGEWSTIFDRGHLTRRNDPTWGPNAKRANIDTFHFANCSPQHWKFNESIEFWQGVERYILEQGLWETGLNKRLTVLQGPLYDAPQPLYADDIEIPNAFWKIVVWKGKGGLKAVALIVDQTDLLSITRVPGGQPDETARVHVAQYRVTVQEIAKRSGLDFMSIAPYDTATGDLPSVGEAREMLKSFSQIKLD